MDTDRLPAALARALAALVLALIVLPASSALAADPACDKTWTGGSGAWGDAAHWTPAGVPSSQVACLPAGSYTVTYPGGLPQANGVVVGAGVTLVTQNDYTSLNSNGGEVVNRGTIQLASRTNLTAPAVANSGTIEDTGLIAVNATPQVLSNTITNSGTIRANSALQLWGNGAGTFTNAAGGKLISNTVASSMSLWALSAVSLTAGTVTNNGDMPVHTAAFTAGSVAGSGLPVRIVGGNPAPAIDLSGAGTLAVDLNSSGYLVADIAKDMALTVRSLGGSPLGSSTAQLILTANRANRGTLGISTDGSYGLDTTIVGSDGTQRLTNEGTLTVTKGSGGSRLIQVPFTNAAAGTVSIGPGTALALRNYNDNLTHVDAGTFAIDPGGSFSVDGAQTMTFTQTGGSIASGGGFEQQAGTFVHQGGTATGRIRVAQRRGYPGLDPSGPGAMSYEVVGTITLAGDVNAAATIEVFPTDDIGTATLALNGNRVNNGTVRLTSTGQYARDSGIAGDGALRDLTNNGRVEVRAGVGGSRILSAQLTNAASGVVDVGPGTSLAVRDFGQADQHTTAGTITVDPTGSLGIDGMPGMTFTQTGGTITTGGGFVQYDGVHRHTAGIVAGKVTLHTVRSSWARLDPSGTGSPTFQIENAQLVGDVAAGTTVNVHGSPAGGFTSLELVGTRTNHGTVQLDGEGDVGSNLSGGAFTNAGTLRVVPGVGHSLSGGVVNVAGGTALFDGDATAIAAGNDGDSPSLVVQGGTVRLAAGLTAWGGIQQTGGATTLSGGNVVIPRNCPNKPANCNVDIAGGTFSGYGALYAPVLNRGGVLQVGSADKPYATLALKDTTEYQHVRQTSYTQTAAGTLSVGVGGKAAGTDFDQMTVEGPAALDGELDISTGASFHPDAAVPDRFEILKAESRSGQWGTLSGDDSGPYAVDYTATGATLQAIQPTGPAVRVGVADAQVAEGNSGTADLVFHVKLAAAAAQPVSVDYATVDDTAIAPGDYTTATGTLSFAPGETDKTVTVKVAGDTAVEGAETLLLRLTHPVGALLGTPRATGTILADDLGVATVSPGSAGDAGPTTLTISGGGLALGDTVTLRRAGSADRTTTILGAAADGTRLAARVDLDGAVHGAWDVRVTAPGGATATAAGAVTVVAGVAPRLAVTVSTPAQLRFGWPGSAIVSIHNEGNADAAVGLLRVTGENAELRTESQSGFHATLDLADEDLTALWTSWGGGNVVPAGETRSVVVRYQSTSTTAHAMLKVRASVYADGLVEQEVGGEDAAPPEGRITGHLRDGDGEPVAGATVTASAPPANGAGNTRGYNAAVAVTKSDGSFALGPLADGSYTVGVGREPTAAPGAEHVTVSGGAGATAELTANVATLAGRLRTSAGAPRAGTISLLRGGEAVATQATAADGGFSFRVLRSGAYTLVGRTASGGLATGAELAVVAGRAQTGIDLRTGSRALTVTVTDGSAPVAGASVAVTTAATKAMPVFVTTGADGKASFDGLPSGAVDVRAASATRAPATASAAGAAATLALGAGATVTGTVTASGAPVATAQVVATAANGERRSAVTDATGKYTITGLPAGAATLWSAGGALAPLKTTATLTAGGTTTANVALTAGGSAKTLTVPGGGVANARFDVVDAATGAVVRSVFSGADGTASTGLLRPGDYTVRIWVPGAAPTEQPLAVAARAAAREARIAAEDDAAPVVDDEADEDNPLDRPPMVSWSGLPEPKQTPWHRAGHQYDYTKILLKEPCPAGNRMKAIISRYTTALSRAWDSYYAAWDVIRLEDRLDVANYLLKAADVGAKATLALTSLNNTVRGLDGPIPGSLSNAIQAMSNNFSAAVARNRMGDTVDVWAIRDGAADVLQAAAAYQQEMGGSAWAGNASDAFAALAALKGVFDLADEVANFPGDVKARGDAYREQENHYYDLQRTINELTNQLRAIAAKCPDPDDDDHPRPSGSGSGISDNVMPGDPNDLLGPQGVGAQGWIPASQDLAYQVRFENVGPGSEHNPQNLPLATAPAVLVKIDEQLDADIDLDSVELGDVGWGTTTVTVPAGRQSYHGDATDSVGDIVRVDGRLDKPTRTLHWTITSIDPKTGETETSPTKGFLPPEDGSGNGQGYASYRARAKSGLAQGTAITAKASIVFDANAVIDTPTHTNTIDITPPVSAVSAVAQPGAGTASCQSTLNVTWGGSDAGAGIAAYDVWVSDDGGAPQPFLLGTTATSGAFGGGQAGHTYAFWTQARDAVGLVEAPPASGDKAIKVARCDSTAPQAVATVTGAAASGGWRGGPVDVRLDVVDDPGGLGVSKLVWSATGAQTGGATVDGDTTTVHVDADGTTELRYSGTDAAGNTTPQRTVTVRIDRAAPTIALRTPADGGAYVQGQAVAVDVSCDDAGSGVATCAGSPAQGAALDTATLGDHTVTVHAEDRLGHAADVTRHYTVTAAPSGGGGGGGGAGGNNTNNGNGANDGGGGRVQGAGFSSRPVSLTAGKATRSGRLTLTLRNLEAFAVTGRATLTGKLPGRRKATTLGGAVSVKLKARGTQTLTVKLSSAARTALRARRTITATVTLTLRSTGITKAKTVKVIIKVRPPR